MENKQPTNLFDVDEQSNDGSVNCVRVQHISKNVGAGEKVARHFDNILNQISKRVGPYAYVSIFKSAKLKQPNESDTIGFIQLKNPDKHRELAFLLKEYSFHGKCLDTQLAYFEFHGIDDDYMPRPVDCRHCNYYSEDLKKWEDDLMQRALEQARKSIIIKPRCSKPHRAVVDTSKSVVDPLYVKPKLRTSSPTKTISSAKSNDESFSIIDEGEFHSFEA